MLTCENLNLVIHGNTIFTGLSFTILNGGILNLHGFNGSGKTSILRMIGGISPIDNGAIFLNGEEITQLSKPYNLYISHQPYQELDLTLEDFLLFWAKIYNSIDLIPAALSYFRITHLWEQKLNTLSAGNLRKAHLSKLLCCNAHLWLLDEPTTNLDDENLALLNNLLLSKVKNNGIIIITSLHPIKEHNICNINLSDYYA